MKALLYFALSLCFIGTVWAETEAEAKTKNFSHESELTIVNAGGNSSLETYNFKMNNTYLYDKKHEFKLTGHYTLGTSADVETIRNWDLLLRYGRSYTESARIYLGEKVEVNKFIGLKSRYSTELGTQINHIDEEKLKFLSEWGYLYAIETETTSETKNKEHKARIYSELVRNFSKDLSGKLWVEIIPNFTESDKYTISFEPSAQMSLSSTFSIKLAYKGTYNNVPLIPGSKKFDFIYTTSFLAKF